MPIALADLVPLIVFGVALALTIMCIALTKAFFGVSGTVLGKLPVVGGWIDATGHHIERRITDVLGGVALKLEAAIGATWHFSARLVDWLGREINRHANLLALIAGLLNPLQVIGALTRGIHDAQAALRGLVHRIEGIGHDLGGRIGHVERGIGRDVLPRVKALERELDHVVLRDVAALRSRSRSLERDYARLYRWMRTHPWTIVTGAFVGAVAIALGRLGLDWIKCNTAKSVFRKHGCSLWSKLDGLLGLVAEGLLVTNMCTVIPWLERGFSVVAAPLISTLTTVGAGLCNPADKPPELLPTVDLHLPAAPGFTLHLP